MQTDASPLSHQENPYAYDLIIMKYWSNSTKKMSVLQQFLNDSLSSNLHLDEELSIVI